MIGEIFLVDDNPSNLSLLAGILRGAGFRVRAANTGKRALSLVKAQLPELIMLDITMPEMDGFEVCQALKADEATRDVPVIFISALDEPLDKVKAFKTGGVDYVTKPFQAEEVVVRVENQLKISRLQRETESKNVELQRAYEQIKTAEEQIARLSQPSSGQLEDTPGWAAAMAGEVSRAIGAREIGVWLLEEGRVTPLAPGGTAPPEAGGLQGPGSGAEFIAPDGSTVVPVTGMTGVPCGALVIDTETSVWGETQRRLISGLAHHLGTALELRSLRRQLSAAEASRAATKRALHDRGIETLLLCPRCGGCSADAVGAEAAAGATCSEDGATLDASRVLPFRVNGRYRFQRLLGEGGMGSVFAAHDETLERDVALKIIKPQLQGDPAMRFRLEREAKVIARIQHPGVTALFDTSELEDGSLVLVMELLKGQGLSSVLSRFGPGTPRQVARLLRQTSAALSAAHRAGVIHRDIKPDNIFLVADNGGFQAKLLDFGVALSIRFDARLTQTGTAVGTPVYMSPEQLQCQDLDERADLYSLACVMWEALVGRRLVQGAQIASIIMNVLNDPPEPVSRFLPEISPAVDQLFEDALAKSRLDRPNSVETWATLLAARLESEPSDAGKGWPSELWAESAASVETSTQEQTTALKTIRGDSSDHE
jgi:eukaryotic-like serine/threonine-protein kinase